MATESFKFWDAYWEAMHGLTYEQRGRFVSALCAYVFDGEEPDVEDPVVAFGYRAVRKQAAESRDISARAAERGRAGGKAHRSTAKSSAKSSVKSSAKSTAKSTAFDCAKAKRSEANGNEASLPLRGSYAAPSPDAAAGGRAPAVRDVPCSDVPPADIPDGMAVDATGAVSWEAPEGA